MRIVRHDNNRRAVAYGREAPQRVCGRLQIGVAVAAVRLEMRAFRPFVPRVDEDEPLLGFELLLGVAARVLEHLPIASRRRVREDAAAARPARFVVPHRRDAAEEHRRRWRLIGAAVFDQILVVVDGALELRVECGDALGRRRRTKIVRRKLHRRVEPELSRVDPVERLGADEIQIADAILAAVAAPVRCGGAGVWQQGRPVDHQHGTAADPDVARIAQHRRDLLDERAGHPRVSAAAR